MKKLNVLISSIAIAFAIYLVTTIDVDADVAVEYHVTTEQQLIDANAAAVAGDVIIIDNDIQLTNQLTVNNNVTIKGSSKYKVTLANSTADTRMMYAKLGVTLENLVFDGQSVNGGVSADGPLIIKNCDFKNNVATNQDGGAVRASQSLQIEDSAFENNTAQSGGGAVYAFNGATITNTTFTGNRLTNTFMSFGGAINISGKASISDVTFADNHADGSAGAGGAVYITGGDASISDSTFTDNSAGAGGSGGGALFIKSSSTAVTNVDNSSFKNNTTGIGGAVSTFFGGTFTNCEFDGNTATKDTVDGGGAIYANSGSVTTENSLYKNNSSIGTGGAISTYKSITANQCIFTGNKTTDPSTLNGNGGATFSYENSNIDECVFTSNSASGLGGATYAHADGVYTNSTFNSNTAAGAGAMYQCLSSGIVTNSTFYNNKGIIKNGVFATSGSGTFDFINSTFVDNATVEDGNQLGNSSMTNFYGSVVDEIPAEPLPWVAYTETIGYLGVENEVFSQKTLLNYDTKVPVGLTSGSETLKLGYVPIKPKGQADDKLAVADNTWVPVTDSLGTTRGTTFSDIGSFEEQGTMKNEVVSGDNQSAEVEKGFAAPLVVRSFYQSAIQPLEVPLENKSFNVTPPASGASGTPSAQMVTTDGTGQASVNVTANSIEGSYQVIFTDADDATQTLSFSLTNTPEVVVTEKYEIVSGDNQSATIETAFSEPLVIRAYTQTSVDPTKVPLANETFNVTVPKSGASGELSTKTVTTDATGHASVQVTANEKDGSYPVVFTNADDTAQKLTFTLTNVAKVTEILEIVSGNNQSATVDTAFAEPLVIRAYTQTSADPTEVPLANKTFNVTVPTSGASGGVSTQTVTTDSLGQASVDVTANGIEGDFHVTFTDAGDASAKLVFALTNVAKPVGPVGPVDPTIVTPVTGKPVITGSTKTPIAATGDDANIGLYSLMVIASLSVIAGVRKRSRKAQ